ncbi:MAG: hypothetical protein ASARMPRED_002607 [Alectoria sarmentosa]|nr:MAG: hypothetical protein ASARMPRED_002607 [Alectoria sarmentosa]
MFKPLDASDSITNALLDQEQVLLTMLALEEIKPRVDTTMTASRRATGDSDLYQNAFTNVHSDGRVGKKAPPSSPPISLTKGSAPFVETPSKKTLLKKSTSFPAATPSKRLILGWRTCVRVHAMYPSDTKKRVHREKKPQMIEDVASLPSSTLVTAGRCHATLNENIQKKVRHSAPTFPLILRFATESRDVFPDKAKSNNHELKDDPTPNDKLNARAQKDGVATGKDAGETEQKLSQPSRVVVTQDGLFISDTLLSPIAYSLRSHKLHFLNLT